MELQTSQEILEEYRNADREKRYDMWFMFQGLREQFDDIGTEKHNISVSKALERYMPR